MGSGVYMIQNTANGKVYVGSSMDVPRRFSQHLRQLRQGVHKSRHLQRAWNRHGQSAFVFAELEMCADESLIAVEQKWIDAMRAADPRHGYNTAPAAGSGRGWKRTEEHRANMRIGRRRPDREDKILRDRRRTIEH
jgi:group I intron endonuclease